MKAAIMGAMFAAGMALMVYPSVRDSLVFSTCTAVHAWIKERRQEGENKPVRFLWQYEWNGIEYTYLSKYIGKGDLRTTGQSGGLLIKRDNPSKVCELTSARTRLMLVISGSVLSLMSVIAFMASI